MPRLACRVSTQVRSKQGSQRVVVRHACRTCDGRAQLRRHRGRLAAASGVGVALVAADAHDVRRDREHGAVHVLGRRGVGFELVRQDEQLRALLLGRRDPHAIGHAAGSRGVVGRGDLGRAVLVVRPRDRQGEALQRWPVPRGDRCEEAVHVNVHDRALASRRQRRQRRRRRQRAEQLLEARLPRADEVQARRGEEVAHEVWVLGARTLPVLRGGVRSDRAVRLRARAAQLLLLLLVLLLLLLLCAERLLLLGSLHRRNAGDKPAAPRARALGFARGGIDCELLSTGDRSISLTRTKQR
eukprot:scaffold66167_cov69-Phaeocystis_antarctica.AAC.1